VDHERGVSEVGTAVAALAAAVGGTVERVASGKGLVDRDHAGAAVALLGVEVKDAQAVIVGGVELGGAGAMNVLARGEGGAHVW
jgi:hypothetical protein